MAKLSTWFSIIRWALILTLLLIILMTIIPIIFPKYFDRKLLDNNDDVLYYRCHLIITILLSLIGCYTICCYYYYLTIIFSTISILYLLFEIYLQYGNIGTYLTWFGVILSSYTYCAVWRRLRNDALYGP